jgi:phage tail-like protein
VRTKYTDLVLKRGMLTDSTALNWFLDVFNNRAFKVAKNMSVILMNEKSEPLHS